MGTLREERTQHFVVEIKRMWDFTNKSEKAKYRFFSVGSDEVSQFLAIKDIEHIETDIEGNKEKLFGIEKKGIFYNHTFGYFLLNLIPGVFELQITYRGKIVGRIKGSVRLNEMDEVPVISPDKAIIDQERIFQMTEQIVAEVRAKNRAKEIKRNNSKRNSLDSAK